MLENVNVYQTDDKWYPYEVVGGCKLECWFLKVSIFLHNRSAAPRTVSLYPKLSKTYHHSAVLIFSSWPCRWKWFSPPTRPSTRVRRLTWWRGGRAASPSSRGRRRPSAWRCRPSPTWTRSPPSWLISSDLTRSHPTSPDLTWSDPNPDPGGGHVPDEEQPAGDGGRDWPILECRGWFHSRETSTFSCELLLNSLMQMFVNRYILLGSGSAPPG